MPKGAFPSLDDTLSTAEKDKVQQPVVTELGTYIVKVTGGPQAGEVSPKMLEALKDQALSKWLGERWDEYKNKDRIYINFDSQWYAWVAKQVRLSSPPGASQSQQGARQ